MAKGILRNRWWVVVASLMAQLVGSGAINIFAFSVFLKPTANELGIGRGVLSSALLVSTIMTAVGCLSFGTLFDRGRIRAALLPAIALYALCVGSLSLLTPSLVIVYLLFGLSGFFGAGQTPLGYSKVISLWFDKERGVALGILQAGVGLGGILVTQVAKFLLHDFGWRKGYAGVGITIFLVAFFPVAMFVREPPAVVAARRSARQSGRQDKMQSGLTSAEILRGSWQFWILAVAIFLVVATANGPLIHAVALLTDRGISLSRATAALSGAGLAMILGRMLAGFCLDRFFGPYVAVGCVGSAMIGIGLLISGRGGLVPVAGTLLCGLGMGAEGDLGPYLVSRYFGLRTFGQIYGYLFAVFMVGVGIGPSLMGISFDRWRSYAPMFIIFEFALLLACILFLCLGPYRFPPEERTADAGEKEVLSSPAIGNEARP